MNNKQVYNFFLDNDYTNFIDKNLVPNLKPILIPDSIKDFPPYCSVKQYDNYIGKLSNGAKLVALWFYSKGQWTNYDPLSGLKGHLLSNLIDFTKYNRVGTIIFDWDRTLTVTEGVLLEQTIKDFLIKTGLEKKGVVPRDLAEYYFGGNKRIERLKKLWSNLKHQGSDIWIVSSNNGISEYHYFFAELLYILGLAVNPSQIIYRGAISKYTYIKKYII